MVNKVQEERGHLQLDANHSAVYHMCWIVLLLLIIICMYQK